MIDVVVRLPRAAIAESLRMNPAGATASLGTPYLALARAILASRYHRRELFAGVRFGEPCWDMILKLYVAAEGGETINVTGLCAVSGKSTATALRHLEDLEARGYFVREADGTDARSTLVVMQAPLRDAVEAWLGYFFELTGVLKR